MSRTSSTATANSRLPSVSSLMLLPATRTVNRLSLLTSKISDGAIRESAQVRTAAIGAWPAANSGPTGA